MKSPWNWISGVPAIEDVNLGVSEDAGSLVPIIERIKAGVEAAEKLNDRFEEITKVLARLDRRITVLEKAERDELYKGLWVLSDR